MIDQRLAERALTEPELIAPGQAPRALYIRRYQDEALRQEMLLLLVVEETPDEIVVVSAYKTSRIDKYFRRSE